MELSVDHKDGIDQELVQEKIKDLLSSGNIGSMGLSISNEGGSHHPKKKTSSGAERKCRNRPKSKYSTKSSTRRNDKSDDLLGSKSDHTALNRSRRQNLGSKMRTRRQSIGPCIIDKESKRRESSRSFSSKSNESLNSKSSEHSGSALNPSDGSELHDTDIALVLRRKKLNASSPNRSLHKSSSNGSLHKSSSNRSLRKSSSHRSLHKSSSNNSLHKSSSHRSLHKSSSNNSLHMSSSSRSLQMSSSNRSLHSTSQNNRRKPSSNHSWSRNDSARSVQSQNNRSRMSSSRSIASDTKSHHSSHRSLSHKSLNHSSHQSLDIDRDDSDINVKTHKSFASIDFVSDMESVDSLVIDLPFEIDDANKNGTNDFEITLETAPLSDKGSTRSRHRSHDGKKKHRDPDAKQRKSRHPQLLETDDIGSASYSNEDEEEIQILTKLSTGSNEKDTRKSRKRTSSNKGRFRSRRGVSSGRLELGGRRTRSRSRNREKQFACKDDTRTRKARSLERLSTRSSHIKSNDKRVNQGSAPTLLDLISPKSKKAVEKLFGSYIPTSEEDTVVANNTDQKYLRESEIENTTSEDQPSSDSSIKDTEVRSLAEMDLTESETLHSSTSSFMYTEESLTNTENGSKKTDSSSKDSKKKQHRKSNIAKGVKKDRTPPQSLEARKQLSGLAISLSKEDPIVAKNDDPKSLIEIENTASESQPSSCSSIMDTEESLNTENGSKRIQSPFQNSKKKTKTIRRSSMGKFEEILPNTENGTQKRDSSSKGSGKKQRRRSSMGKIMKKDRAQLQSQEVVKKLSGWETPLAEEDMIVTKNNDRMLLPDLEKIKDERQPSSSSIKDTEEVLANTENGTQKRDSSSKGSGKKQRRRSSMGKITKKDRRNSMGKSMRQDRTPSQSQETVKDLCESEEDPSVAKNDDQKSLPEIENGTVENLLVSSSSMKNTEEILNTENGTHSPAQDSEKKHRRRSSVTRSMKKDKASQRISNKSGHKTSKRFTREKKTREKDSSSAIEVNPQNDKSTKNDPDSEMTNSGIELPISSEDFVSGNEKEINEILNNEVKESTKKNSTRKDRTSTSSEDFLSGNEMEINDILKNDLKESTKKHSTRKDRTLTRRKDKNIRGQDSSPIEADPQSDLSKNNDPNDVVNTTGIKSTGSSSVKELDTETENDINGSPHKKAETPTLIDLFSSHEPVKKKESKLFAPSLCSEYSEEKDNEKVEDCKYLQLTFLAENGADAGNLFALMDEQLNQSKPETGERDISHRSFISFTNDIDLKVSTTSYSLSKTVHGGIVPADDYSTNDDFSCDDDGFANDGDEEAATKKIMETPKSRKKRLSTPKFSMSSPNNMLETPKSRRKRLSTPTSIVSSADNIFSFDDDGLANDTEEDTATRRKKLATPVVPRRNKVLPQAFNISRSLHGAPSFDDALFSNGPLDESTKRTKRNGVLKKMRKGISESSRLTFQKATSTRHMLGQATTKVLARRKEEGRGLLRNESD